MNARAHSRKFVGKKKPRLCVIIDWGLQVALLHENTKLESTPCSSFCDSACGSCKSRVALFLKCDKENASNLLSYQRQLKETLRRHAGS